MANQNRGERLPGEVLADIGALLRACNQGATGARNRALLEEESIARCITAIYTNGVLEIMMPISGEPRQHVPVEGEARTHPVKVRRTRKARETAA